MCFRCTEEGREELRGGGTILGGTKRAQEIEEVTSGKKKLQGVLLEVVALDIEQCILVLKTLHKIVYLPQPF